MLVAKEKHSERLFAYSVLERAVPLLWRELLYALADNVSRVEEIRLRANGPSSYKINGGDKYLGVRVTAKELGTVFDALTGGSTYLYTEGIGEGYVTVSGVRVGLVGRPGALSALVFRLPLSVIGSGEELYRTFLAYGAPGVLIASRPGGGKTTALRALAMHIGMAGYKVAAVDTRGEFLASDYSAAAVDVITGLGRKEGMRVAISTLSPDFIACDEIFTDEDVDALISAHGSGVKVLATVHCGDDINRILRGKIGGLLDIGAFGLVIEITRRGAEFLYTPMGVSDAQLGNITDTFSLSFC